MTALLKFVLGMLGAASLAGSAWLYLSDGGLALALRDRDQVFEHMNEADRSETLEQWSGLVKEYAQAKRDQAADDSSEQSASSSSSSSRASATTSKAEPRSETYDKVLGLVEDFGPRLNQAGSRWREKQDTSGLEDVVADLRLAYETSLEAWPGISSVERSLIADTLERSYTTLRSRFGGVHSSYGAALVDGSPLDVEMHELNDRRTLFIEGLKP